MIGIEEQIVVNEATTLNKKEEAITDPKELEQIIERWEKAASGEEPIINKQTNEPVTTKYCKDKLRVLKKKLEQLKSGSSNSSSNKESNIPENIQKSLQELGFTADPSKPGVFKNEKYTDNLSVGIAFNNVTSESVSAFIKIYNNIILEDAEETTCNLVFKTNDMKEQKVIENFKISNTVDTKKLKETINAAITNEIENLPENKMDGIDTKKIEESFKKLDEDEREAFIQFYGKFNKENKVFKFLTELNNKINEEG